MNRLAMPRTDAVVRWFRRLVPAYVSSRAGAWWIHRVAPLPASEDATRLLRRLERVVGALPRTEAKTVTDEYLHAVCRRLLGFRDDLEFRLSPAEGVVHVQSVSRVGLFDFGVTAGGSSGCVDGCGCVRDVASPSDTERHFKLAADSQSKSASNRYWKSVQSTLEERLIVILWTSDRYFVSV